MQLKEKLEKEEKRKVIRLSKHVSYREGVYSRTAERLGLNNEPNSYHLSNMELLAEKVFEPLRKHVNGPIKINSFYRSPELNQAIGGSSKSQHCMGQAIDIDTRRVQYRLISEHSMSKSRH